MTEQLSKVDIQVVAMRFDDGTGSVCIPEFLEFFSSTPQMRVARASASAVRLSFDMIQIEEQANRVYGFDEELLAAVDHQRGYGGDTHDDSGCQNSNDSRKQLTRKVRNYI